MFATLAFTTFFALFATIAPTAQGIHVTVLSKTITECEPIKVNVGGNGPLTLSVVHADDPCGEAFDSIKTTNGANVPWTANLPVGTKIQFAVEENDSDNEDWSETFTIEKGTTSCLNKTSSSTTASTTPAVTNGTATPPPSTNITTDGTDPADGASNVESTTTNGALPRLSPTVGMLGAVAAFALALAQI